MSQPELQSADRLDVVVRGGRVLDPGRGVDTVMDVGIADGRIARVEPVIRRGVARRVVDARGKLVIPGMIDTHAHVYEHVTGSFGLNPDLVGVRAGVTTVVDQGGAGALTIDGFRKFIAEPAATRVLAFISNYLVGGLVGHRYTALYGPSGIDVRETVRAIDKHRGLVKGIKAHGEVGGYSRWGVETLRLGTEASRQAGVPVYVHLGRLWSDAAGASIDPDTVVPEVVPLLAPGDILAHPFTKNPGAFVSREGRVHPLIFEAVKAGVHIDIGRGGHMSYRAARAVLDAGIMPFTVGGDVHGYTIGQLEDRAWDGGYFDETPSDAAAAHGHRRRQGLQPDSGAERVARPRHSARGHRAHGHVQCRRDARHDGRDRHAGTGRGRRHHGARHRPRALHPLGQPRRGDHLVHAPPARDHGARRQGQPARLPAPRLAPLGRAA